MEKLVLNLQFNFNIEIYLICSKIMLILMINREVYNVGKKDTEQSEVVEDKEEGFRNAVREFSSTSEL